MLNSLKTASGYACTENGAAAYRSSGSDCVDLFATAGALRNADENEIISRFLRAYSEDRDLAMKTLFFARDIRGGLGERRMFRTVLSYLAYSEPHSVRKNVGLIAEYGRWDDLLTLLGTPCETDAVECIRRQLEKDIEAAKSPDAEVSLLAKWLPSVNASSTGTVQAAKTLARVLGLSDREYRRTLTALRARIRILENSLRERDYTFDYSKQPSKAMFKYRKAFLRNDGERYLDYLHQVRSGDAVLHTGTLFPYELVDPLLDWDPQRGDLSFGLLSEEEKTALNTTWAALPDFTNGENALAVIDTSGSMYGPANPKPAAVALSLGLYFAERNHGAFANHFIEFSRHARLIEVKGDTFYDRLRYLLTFNEVANTDIGRVFDLILSAALQNSVPASELPKKLFLISDMEFDCAVEGASVTCFESARRRFEAVGYTLPKVIFWNVASRALQVPVRMHETGATLISGCSPRLFSMVMNGELSPYRYMLGVLGSERYRPVAA